MQLFIVILNFFIFRILVIGGINNWTILWTGCFFFLQLVVVDDIVAAATKKGRIVKKPAEPQKKASEIANNDLVVISSDEEENVKEVEAKNEKIKPVGEQSSKERSLRRNDRTFTSVLTARSKVVLMIFFLGYFVDYEDSSIRYLSLSFPNLFVLGCLWNH